MYQAVYNWLRNWSATRSALTREIGAMRSDGMLVCGADWMQLDKDKIG